MKNKRLKSIDSILGTCVHCGWQGSMVLAGIEPDGKLCCPLCYQPLVHLSIKPAKKFAISSQMIIFSEIFAIMWLVLVYLYILSVKVSP